MNSGKPTTILSNVFGPVEEFVIMGVIGNHLRCAITKVEDNGSESYKDTLVGYGSVPASERGKFQRAIKAYR